MRILLTFILLILYLNSQVLNAQNLPRQSIITFNQGSIIHSSFPDSLRNEAVKFAQLLDKLTVEIIDSLTKKSFTHFIFYNQSQAKPGDKIIKGDVSLNLFIYYGSFNGVEKWDSSEQPFSFYMQYIHHLTKDTLAGLSNNFPSIQNYLHYPERLKEYLIRCYVFDFGNIFPNHQLLKPDNQVNRKFKVIIKEAFKAETPEDKDLALTLTHIVNNIFVDFQNQRIVNADNSPQRTPQYKYNFNYLNLYNDKKLHYTPNDLDVLLKADLKRINPDKYQFNIEITGKDLIYPSENPRIIHYFTKADFAEGNFIRFYTQVLSYSLLQLIVNNL